jgi:hypothetical protein
MVWRKKSQKNLKTLYEKLVPPLLVEERKTLLIWENVLEKKRFSSPIIAYHNYALNPFFTNLNRERYVGGEVKNRYFAEIFADKIEHRRLPE